MLYFLIQANDENVRAMWEDGHFYRGRVLENCNEGNQKDNNCLVQPPPPPLVFSSILQIKTIYLSIFT